MKLEKQQTESRRTQLQRPHRLDLPVREASFPCTAILSIFLYLYVILIYITDSDIFRITIFLVAYGWRRQELPAGQDSRGHPIRLPRHIQSLVMQGNTPVLLFFKMIYHVRPVKN
jgi:hypothetical protein